MGSFLSRALGLDPIPETNGEGYIPSKTSAYLAVAKKSDYKPVEFDKKYTGNKKILVTCTEIKYMVMENGKKFSTGNHPVEICQPLMILALAGFDFDVATPTGKPSCVEEWALPRDDEAVLEFYEKAKSKLNNPKSLAKIMSGTALDDYVAVFAPGGQGAMLGLPFDENMGKLIKTIKDTDRFFISICHGPAVLLAAKNTKPHPYEGCKVACFPDTGDKMSPNLGYMPGVQTWYYGEKLISECGITIVNTQADSTMVQDGKLFTGASPMAGQKLGTAVAEALLEAYA